MSVSTCVSNLSRLLSFFHICSFLRVCYAVLLCLFVCVCVCVYLFLFVYFWSVIWSILSCFVYPFFFSF